MSIFGDNKELGAGVNHRISLNGVLQDWDSKALGLSAVTNEASTFDDRRRISDLTMTIADVDGSIWTALGNGTTAFGKSITVTTTTGGTFGVKTFGQVQGYGQRGTEGGTTYTTHIGSIVEVNRGRRTVSLRSKNNMDRLNDLSFKFPLNIYDNFDLIHELDYEDFSFIKERGTLWNSIRDNGGMNLSPDKTGCDFYAAPKNVGDDLSIDATGFYDGSVVTISSDYVVMADDFYRQHTHLKFTGSYIGTYIGTLRNDPDARRYGYPSIGSAEASKISNGDQTFSYPINRIRIKWPNKITQDFDNIAPAAHITMESDYTDILKYLIAGRFIYRRFTSTDLDSVSFGKSSSIGAFSAFRGTVYTNEDKVIPHIDDVVKVTNAMFSVNNNNKFQFFSYGPVELAGALGTILQKDVIDSSFNNRVEDAYNRFVLNYKYDKDTDTFGTKNEKALANWTVDSDRLLELDSRWLFNDNEASNFTDQVRTRYVKTVPTINFTTPLNKGGIEIGDLLYLTDADIGVSNKIIQIRKFTKDFPNSKSIDFEGLDGENLYYGRGWAYWGSETAPTTVTGASRSGWGDGLSGSTGTVHNINQAVYGSAFRWW